MFCREGVPVVSASAKTQDRLRSFPRSTQTHTRTHTCAHTNTHTHTHTHTLWITNIVGKQVK